MLIIVLDLARQVSVESSLWFSLQFNLNGPWRVSDLFFLSTLFFCRSFLHRFLHSVEAFSVPWKCPLWLLGIAFKMGFAREIKRVMRTFQWASSPSAWPQRIYSINSSWIFIYFSSFLFWGKLLQLVKSESKLIKFSNQMEIKSLGEGAWELKAFGIVDSVIV